MNPDKKGFWLVVRLLACGVVLLVAVAVMAPNFVPARFESSGVPVIFRITVLDAENNTGVAGAKTLVGFRPDQNSEVNASNVGGYSATTDASGTCEVVCSLPGSGSFKKGLLRVNSYILIHAEGFESWQKPSADLLGKSVIVTNPFASTNSFLLKIPLTRKPA